MTAVADLWKDAWERHRIRLCQAGGALLILIAKPRSNPLFLLGLCVALSGEAVRAWAAGHIRKGAALAREGPYAMTRHPLYLGSLIMSCGLCIMCTSLRHWASTGLVWGAVLATFYWLYPQKMASEEKGLTAVFGGAFRGYRDAVPGFWPDPRLWGEALRSSHWDLRQAMRNKEHKTLLALLGLAVLLRFKMVYRL